MSHHQGMKYTEIAIALGISVRTVEDRIARTKNHFRKILNRYWLIVLLFLFLN
ncbi:MAG: sigma factor-like helix-turn-helix DNA-binding protein [Alistipes communis]